MEQNSRALEIIWNCRISEEWPRTTDFSPPSDDCSISSYRPQTPAFSTKRIGKRSPERLHCSRLSICFRWQAKRTLACAGTRIRYSNSPERCSGGPQPSRAPRARPMLHRVRQCYRRSSRCDLHRKSDFPHCRRQVCRPHERSSLPREGSR